MSFRASAIQKILLLTGFLDLFAVSLIITQFQAYLHQLGVSPFLNGLIGSMYGAVQLFSSPVMGNWSDVRGRKFTLQMCLLITACSYFLLGYSSVLFLVIVSRFVLGMFKHSQTLCRAHIAESIPGNKKSHMLGYFNSTSSLGFIVGPALSGHMAEWENGFSWICTLSSAVFVINFCIISFTLPDDKPPDKKFKSRGHSFSVFNYECWHDQWTLLAVRFFLSLSVLMFRNNLSLLLLENLHLGKKSVGYIISFQGIVSSITGFFVGFIYNFFRNSQKLLLYTSVLQVIALCGLTFAPNVWLLLAFFIPLSASNSITRVCITTSTASRCHKSELGAMVGVGQSVTSVARMLSPFTAGVAQHISIYGPGIGGIISSCIGCSILAFDSFSFYTNNKFNKKKLS